MTTTNGNDFSKTGRYKIISVLGAGGMGEVFLAKDLELEREVAIKTIKRQVATKERIRLRTQREAILLSRLRHPSLVPVYEMNMETKIPYIVQGYVDGCNLREKINEGRLLSEKQAWNLFLEQASVLSYIHGQGLLHRDIKPANIMIDQSGHSILMDFGLALDENQTRLTGDGKFIGTMLFSSPEVLLGDPSAPASDIFQLGLTIYEAYTGEFYIGDFDNLPDFADALLGAQWDRRNLSSHVPQKLGELITRCLRFNVEDRIQNGMELQELLRANNIGALVDGPNPDSGEHLSDSMITGRSGNELKEEGETPDDGTSAIDSETSRSGPGSSAVSGSDLSRSMAVVSSRSDSRTPYIVLFMLVLFMGVSFYLFRPSSVVNVSVETPKDLFAEARSWFLFDDGFYLFLPTTYGTDLKWQLVSGNSKSGNSQSEKGLEGLRSNMVSMDFERVPGGWKGVYSFDKSSLLAKNRTCRLNILSEGKCIAGKDITFPLSSFKEPFRAFFSYDRVYLKWKLHGRGEVNISVAPSADTANSKSLSRTGKISGKNDHSFVNYPQWLGKKLICSLVLPSGKTSMVSIFGGFSMVKGDKVLPGVDSEENIQDALAIENMIYLTTRRGWFSVHTCDDELKFLYKFMVGEPYNRSQKNPRQRVNPAQCVPRVISPSKNGVALWGMGNGKSVIYAGNDGGVLVKKITSPLKKFYFDTIQSTSGSETLLSALGSDGKIYFFIHNIKNETVKVFRQPTSGVRPSIMFSVDGSFFCWYGSKGPNDTLYEVVVKGTKLRLNPVAAITGCKDDEFRIPESLADGDMPRPRTSFTKAVVDKEKKIAVLSNGVGIYSLRKKDGRFKLSAMNFPGVGISIVEGVGIIGDGKFVAVVPKVYISGKPLSGLIRELGLLYITFNDGEDEATLRLTGTTVSVHKLKDECAVRGPHIRDGYLFFSVTSDFYAMALSADKAVFSSIFYSVPDRISIVGDTLLVFQDHKFLLGSITLGPPRSVASGVE